MIIVDAVQIHIYIYVYIYMIIDHIAFTIVLDITMANLFGRIIRMPTIFCKC